MEPTASRPARPEPAPDPRALAALLASEADLDALERGLMAAALHPSVGGAEHVWLLRHDVRRELLAVARESAGPSGEPDLAQAIARARRRPPESSADPAHRPSWATTAEELEGALDIAWNAGRAADGPGGAMAGAPWAGFAQVSAVPLRQGTRKRGLLVSAWRSAEGPGRSGAALLQTLADASLAAQALAAEARRRSRAAVAFAEFARLAVTDANLAEAMHGLVRLAAHASQASCAAFYRVREDGTPRIEVVHGPAPHRELQARALLAAALETIQSRNAASGLGASSLPGPALEGTGEISVWALQPVLAHGRLHGLLAVWDGPERDPSAPGWERGDLEGIALLADQAALLFEHARRLEESAALERRREDLATRLREQDRLAALGEMAARIAEETRTPLAAMTAFAERALAGLPAGDPQRETYEAIVREAERAGALLHEQLEYAKLDPPRLRVESLNTVVQEALRVASDALSRRRVRLVKTFAPDLPKLLLDASRIRRVVANVVACALEQLPMGGRVRIETRRAGAYVVLEVLHDRSREQGDALEQLFAPFAAASGAALPGTITGAALGLGMAHQIVREHGGEIRVRIEDEWSSAFVMTLPVMDNQDRRQASDRRAARRDRRRREPGA